MTKYYSNQPDFSTEAPDPAYNYFSSMSDIMDNIEAAGNTVKSEGVEDLYTQKGEAALGVKKDSSIFDKSIQRIYNMLNSAKKVHSDIMQNIDNKFTRGMDDAFKSLNNVNGDKKPYESKYTKKDTIKYKQEAGPNGFEQRAYNDPQPYKLHELLDGKASPIEAAKDVYETRLQAAKAYLAQKDKLTDKEIKNLEGKSAEDIVEAYFPSQIPDYQGLKASRFQEENKDTLQKVDIGLKALAFLAAAGGVIFAPFTSGASLTLTYASGAYLFADNAYSAWTGQTMITGDRLSTEDRVWAGIDAATTLASMGSLAYLTKFGTSGPNLLKNLATLGKYADDANDVSKVFYAAATDQDPSSAIQNLVIGQVASFGVGKASNYFGGKFSRGGTPDLDVDLPGAKASHLDVPLQSKQIPKLDPANVRLSSRPDLHLKASPADGTLAKLKTHPTVRADLPKVKQVSGDSATKAIGGVKPSDVDVPKVKGTANPSPSQSETRAIIDQKLKEYGVSWDEFNRLRNTHVTKMTQSEYDMMIDIRNTIPYPKNSTVMQKIMPIDAEVWLFNKKEKATAGGFVARRSDVKNITNIREAVEGLRLDYEGSPFVETMIDANGNRVAVRDQNGNLVLKTDAYLRLEYTTDETGYIQIPYGDMDGNSIDADGNIIMNQSTGEPNKVIDPASGNGFIKSDSDEFLVPEYIHSDKSRLKEGSKLYLNVGGEEVLVGRVNKDGIMEYVEG